MGNTQVMPVFANWQTSTDFFALSLKKFAGFNGNAKSSVNFNIQLSINSLPFTELKVKQKILQ
jgi:hypothetical protein